MTTSSATIGGPTRWSLREVRAQVAAATQAVAALRELLWQAGGSELPDLLTEVDTLSAAAAGARVAVVTEAHTRGEISGSQAGSATQWIRAHAPTLAAHEAGHLAAVVRTCTSPSRRAELAPVLDGATSGQLAVPVAARVLREFDSLAPDLLPDARPTVLEGLVSLGRDHGVTAVRALRPRLLAEYGSDGRLQQEQDRAAYRICLSTPVGSDVEGWVYRLTTDAEGKAVIEAALTPLTRPQAEAGQPDPRPMSRRRGEALVQLVCRAVRAATAVTTGGNPASVSGIKSTVLVTMDLQSLTSQLGAATTIGPLGDPTLLAPETVRRLACDGGIIPIVLGSVGEVLDVGREHRLVPPALLKVLWQRDRTCTFPGCDLPGWFADAHHIRHWADHGATSVDNLTLLCGRHHTIVHRDRLTAGVVDGRIVWDTTVGSLDRHPPPPQPAHPPRGPTGCG